MCHASGSDLTRQHVSGMPRPGPTVVVGNPAVGMTGCSPGCFASADAEGHPSSPQTNQDKQRLVTTRPDPLN